MRSAWAVVPGIKLLSSSFPEGGVAEESSFICVVVAGALLVEDPREVPVTDDGASDPTGAPFCGGGRGSGQAKLFGTAGDAGAGQAVLGIAARRPASLSGCAGPRLPRDPAGSDGTPCVCGANVRSGVILTPVAGATAAAPVLAASPSFFKDQHLRCVARSVWKNQWLP